MKTNSDTPSFQNEGTTIADEHKQLLDQVILPETPHCTFHMVHINHLDLTWYWRLPDTLEMCLETIRWNVELLETHPDAIYSHTQAFTLNIIRILDPALFQRVVSLVQAGKIELDSGQVVEPDHNMPGGESLIRQYLYGQKFYEYYFNTRSTVTINSDSFGQTRSLPQIMDSAGITAMLFKRPREKYVSLPETPFYWEGIDGTSILALRFLNKGRGLPTLSEGYTMEGNAAKLQAKITWNQEKGNHHFIGTLCQADSGGVSPYVSEINHPQYTLKYSTPSEFFSAVKAQAKCTFPRLNTLFNYVFQGCYTTHIHEKENLRRAERLFYETEWLYTRLIHAHVPYPRAALNAYWWRFSYLQFHDIVTGTGSHEAHLDSSAHYHELFTHLRILQRKAQICIDSRIPSSHFLRTFVVANPRPHQEQGIVAIDVEMPIHRDQHTDEQIPTVGFLETEASSFIPYQIVDTRTYQRYVRGTLLMCCTHVHPLGLQRFGLKLSQLESNVENGTYALDVSETGLENMWIKVSLDEKGWITQIQTKEDGYTWLNQTVAPIRIELWVEDDFPMEYGTEMRAWQLGITNHYEIPTLSKPIQIIERGPVRTTLRTEHTWQHSTFKTDISLYANQPWVELRLEMDWHEKDVLARLYIEPSLEGEWFRHYGIPLGYERATGEEMELPAVGWVDVSTSERGIALLNKDRPGHSFQGNTIRSSIVRCATGDWDPCTDKGTIQTTYRIIPHSQPFYEAQIPYHAQQFQQPLFGWQAEPTGFNETHQDPFSITLDTPAIQLIALKLAEDGGGVIIRLVETSGKAVSSTLTFGEGWKTALWSLSTILEDTQDFNSLAHQTVSLSFTAFELKTIYIQSPKPFQMDQTGCTYDIFSWGTQE
jgi:alpha-mannosidase